MQNEYICGKDLPSQSLIVLCIFLITYHIKMSNDNFKYEKRLNAPHVRGNGMERPAIDVR